MLIPLSDHLIPLFTLTHSFIKIFNFTFFPIDEKILGLQKEAEHANELLEVARRRGVAPLTDEQVEALSPSAAAASRLLKSGMTLTQVSEYRSYLYGYVTMVSCLYTVLGPMVRHYVLNFGFHIFPNLLKNLSERHVALVVGYVPLHYC